MIPSLSWSCSNSYCLSLLESKKDKPKDVDEQRDKEDDLAALLQHNFSQQEQTPDEVFAQQANDNPLHKILCSQGGSIYEILHCVALENWHCAPQQCDKEENRKLVWKDRSKALNFLFGLPRWGVSHRELLQMILTEYHFCKPHVKPKEHIRRDMVKERKELLPIRYNNINATYLNKKKSKIFKFFFFLLQTKACWLCSSVGPSLLQYRER